MVKFIVIVLISVFFSFLLSWIKQLWGLHNNPAVQGKGIFRYFWAETNIFFARELIYLIGSCFSIFHLFCTQLNRMYIELENI